MNMSSRAALVLACLALSLLAPAADWEMQPTNSVSVSVMLYQAPVATAKYCFWGENWKHAGTRLRLTDLDGPEKTFSGTVEALGLSVAGTITSPAKNQLRYVWRLSAERDLQDIVGGGLEFGLNPGCPSFGVKPPDPELLPDNRGWRWQVATDQALKVEFDRPIASVYFERGNKSKIRTMFVGKQLSKGIHEVAMTITLPEGGEIVPTLAERYGAVDTAKWFSDALAYDGSPIDVSFLNHTPAGKHGFVRADGDRLVFEDGTEARFWGGNIAASAISAEKPHIEAQARRIAQLGYNLMRIHHHDSTRWVGKTVIDKTRPDSQHLNDEVMDRLDYWIKCLKDQGVYVWLDLHVGRQFKKGDDITEGFEEMIRRASNPEDGVEGKGYCYFNPRIEELMREFNEKYLTHVNRYTGLAYKDDPAVMGLLLTNENDLTCHFGNLVLPDKNNPWHHGVFAKAARAFATQHGLDAGQVGQTWLPGVSKLFLADREHAWNRRMLDHLSGLGVRVPVATTHMWGGMILCGLPALTAGGIIDVHSYGGTEALSVNPRFQGNYISYVASGQACGKPVAITEWNVPYPKVDRFTSPLYMASICALQEWDAPMIYNYSQRTFGKPTRPGTWSSFTDPALTGLMPAAAVMYRQAHVRPASEAYILAMDRESLYLQGSHPKNMASLRTLVEKSKVAIGLPDVKELGWDAASEVPDGAQVVHELDRDFIPPGQNFVRSDTDELTRYWVDGYQTIDTPRTQAAHGWVGGRAIQLQDVSLDLDIPKAAVAVTSLDGKPIAESQRILITAIARAVASSGNRMPLLSEPVRGRLSIRAPKGSSLVPLAGDGRQLAPLDAIRADGRYSISLPAERGTHWFLLTATRPTD
jgi:hypothetical protein